VAWKFGIRRAQIEEDTISIISAVLVDYESPGFDIGTVGMPPERIFVADQSDSPLPPRPYVSLTMDSPQLQGPAGRPTSAEIRRYPVTEVWRVTVTDNVDATYTITMKGVDFDFIAVGETITGIRDGLVTALAAQLEATVATLGSNALVLTSVNIADRLAIVTSPISLIARQTRAQILSRMTWAAYCVMKIRCFGFFDDETPDPEQSGEHIAENIAMGLLHSDITANMRRHCHIFRKVLSMPGFTGTFEQEVRSVGAIDLLLQTEARMDATLSNATRVAGVVNTFPFLVSAPAPAPPP